MTPQELARIRANDQQGIGIAWVERRALLAYVAQLHADARDVRRMIDGGWRSLPAARAKLDGMLAAAEDTE